MWTLLVLLGVYAGTSALGTGLRFKLIDTSGFRWVHHALFGLIWLALAIAIAYGFNYSTPWRWLVILIAPLMAVLPRFRTGSASHCLTAAAGLVFLVVAIAWAAIV
jgi:hypothetical protein